MLYIAPFIVIAVRLFVPLTIFKWPFWGALLSIIVDYFDFNFLNQFGWGFLNNGRDWYQPFDKSLDLYYLSIEFYMVAKWRNIFARRIGVGLFLWRLIGIVFFIFTQVNLLMFIFANIFENFYLLITGINRYFPNYNLTRRHILAILGISAIAKLPHEYYFHVYHQLLVGGGSE